MESTENGVQAEKKEATKDDSEQVKAEVAPAEKVEKVEKTEEKVEKAEEKAEKAEKTEEKAEKPPQKAEEPEKEKVEEKKLEEVKKEEEKKVEEVKKEEEKKVEEVKKEEEKKVEEVKKEEEKVEVVEEKAEETKKSDEKVEEVKETEKVEETVEEEVVEEEEEEEVVEEVEEEEESKEKKEEKTETVEKDESSKAKEESEPTEKEETKEPQEEVGSAPEPKPESDSGSDEELIIEEEEVDEDEDEEETKEVVIIRRPVAKDTEKKEAAEPKKEVAVTNGEAEEEEVEALTVKLHSKVKVEDEKTESAEPERKEESPKKVAEPEPAAKAEPKEEVPVREQPTYEPPRQEYSPRPQGYYSYENRDVPQVKRDFSQYDRDVPRVERDYPPHIYTGHKYSYLDRETPRVQREEPPRVLREEPPRVQREEPTRFRQEFPSQFQAPSYTQWPPSKQSHVSYETEEIRETVRETSGAGPMRREVYDERLVRQEYKSRDGSSQGPKQVDLQKIFTPATDSEEIIPKNRKLYASSAFYSPGLHPTVEDQVELARKISHSLSDSNNQQSKGQSMYVNRKKRSVKWVHEGEGTATIAHEYNEESKENNFENRVSSRSFEKVPLKLVMDPRGQVKTPSFNDYNIDAGMQSPEICADIMKSLHAPKGKGAELFAKRRKKSENWIVDETNTSNSSSQGLHETTYGQATGIPSTGPQEYSSYDQYQYSQSPYAAQKTLPKSEPYEKVSSYTTKTESSVYSATRDLAYKPSIPRGWNAPAPSLPKNLYTPPGIPLDSYAPPPEVSVPSPTQPSWAASSSLHTSQSPYYPSPSSYTAEPVSSEPTYSSPTKQPGYYSPSKSPYSPSLAQGYKRPQPPQSNVQLATPSINFNPSPLPYEKLEKFDRPSTPPSYTPYTYRGTKSPVVSSFPKSQPTYKPQPKYEQPKYEAPKYETPNYETPKYEPPKYEQPKYEPYQSETQLSPPISRNGYSTTPTYPSKSPVYPSFPSEIPVCSRVSPGEVMRGPTFNTAPRGWNQMRDYYRPVTLDDPKQYAHMSYTDF